MVTPDDGGIGRCASFGPFVGQSPQGRLVVATREFGDPLLKLLSLEIVQRAAKRRSRGAKLVDATVAQQRSLPGQQRQAIVV